eukprot:scaffold51628_cov36-Phaeocystis_antarctica.AAC.1
MVGRWCGDGGEMVGRWWGDWRGELPIKLQRAGVGSTRFVPRRAARPAPGAVALQGAYFRLSSLVGLPRLDTRVQRRGATRGRLLIRRVGSGWGSGWGS